MEVETPQTAAPPKPPRKPTGGPRPGSGRPRLIPRDERNAIEAARSLMRAYLPRVVRMWVKGLKHRCEVRHHDCYGYRIRCAENIAKRGGLPEMQAIRAEIEQKARPVLVFDFPDPFPDADTAASGFASPPRSD